MYVELIRDSYPFKAGTQFKVTGGDDGFWSRHAFYSGRVTVKGKERRISADRDACKYLDPEKFESRVIVEKEKPSREESWWEYTNYP
jgi:hypothetical protein